MAQCGGLNSSNRNLFAERRSAFLRKHCPSMDKVTRDLEIRSHHCALVDLAQMQVAGGEPAQQRGYMLLLQ
jgi:hypothetical protein